MRCSLPAAATAVLLLGANIANADMIDTAGMEPWEVCGLCHGLDGLSATAKFPRLAAQNPDYIAKQLLDFRDGRRENDGGQMRDIASEVAPDDIPAIAAWFASQQPPAPDASTADAERGQALYAEKDCASCHEGRPEGLAPPQLQAQHARYLTKQLLDFRDGARTNDPDGVMQAVAEELADDEIEALADYLAASPRP